MRQTGGKQRLMVVAGLIITALASGFVFDRIPIRNLARAEAAKIVSISFCGKNRVVTTEAATVSELLKRLSLTVKAGDRVEPSLATAIPSGFFNINVYCSQPYRILDGVRVTTVQSAQQTPRLIAADAHVTIYPEDKVTVEPVSDFVDARVVGQDILVERAKLIHVTADGQSIPLRSRQATVGDFLIEKGIQLGEKDTVAPPLTAPLTDGMTIVITRVAVVVSVKDEIIAKPVVRKNDATLLRGTVKVQDEGSDGMQKVTYELTYNNGVVVKTRQLAAERLVEPTPRVEIIGTKVFYPNEVAALAGSLAAERGWVNEQWDALFSLWTKESNFNPAARNGSSGACGIPQAYPCSKLPGFPDDPEAQINWGLNYIATRYGNPVNAWNYWLSHHSY